MGQVNSNQRNRAEEIITNPEEVFVRSAPQPSEDELILGMKCLGLCSLSYNNVEIDPKKADFEKYWAKKLNVVKKSKHFRSADLQKLVKKPYRIWSDTTNSTFTNELILESQAITGFIYDVPGSKSDRPVPFVCFRGSTSIFDFYRDLKSAKSTLLYTSKGRVAGGCGSGFFEMHSELLKPFAFHPDPKDSEASIGSNTGVSALAADATAKSISAGIKIGHSDTKSPSPKKDNKKKFKAAVSAVKISGAITRNKRKSMGPDALSTETDDHHIHEHDPDHGHEGHDHDSHDSVHIDDYPLQRLMDVVLRNMDYADNGLIICGHSLGGAVSTLFYAELLHDYPELVEKYKNKIHVVTFGSPRAVDLRLADKLDQSPVTHLRFVNDNDIITAVPPRRLELFYHWGKCLFAPERFYDDQASYARRWLVMHDPKRITCTEGTKVHINKEDFGVDRLHSNGIWTEFIECIRDNFAAHMLTQEKGYAGQFTKVEYPKIVELRNHLPYLAKDEDGDGIPDDDQQPRITGEVDPKNPGSLPNDMSADRGLTVFKVSVRLLQNAWEKFWIVALVLAIVYYQLYLVEEYAINVGPSGVFGQKRFFSRGKL